MSSLFRNDFSTRLTGDSLIRKTNRDASADVAFRFFLPAAGTPQDVFSSNLRRWYNASYNGSTGVWIDDAQIANTASSGSNPNATTINGNTAVNFIGTTSLDAGGNDTFATDAGRFTLFCVFKYTSGNDVAFQHLFGKTYNSYGYALSGAWVTPVTGAVGAYSGNSGSGVASSAGLDNGIPHRFIATFDGKTLTGYVDGVSIGSTTANAGPVPNDPTDALSIGAGVATGGGAQAYGMVGVLGQVGAADVAASASDVASLDTYLSTWAGTGVVVKTVTCSAAGAGSVAIAKVTHNAAAITAVGAGATSLVHPIHNEFLTSAGAGSASLVHPVHNVFPVAHGAGSASLPFLTHFKTGITTAGAGATSIAKITHNAAAITANGAGSVSLLHPVHNVFPVAAGAGSASLLHPVHNVFPVAAGAGSVAIAKVAHNAAAISAAGAGAISFSRTQHILGALTVAGAGSVAITVQKVGGIKNVSPSAAGAGSVSLPFLTHLKTGISFTGTGSATIGKVTHNAAAITATGAGAATIGKVTHNAAAITATGAGSVSISKVTHNAKAASCAGAASCSLSVVRIKFVACSATGAGACALVHPVHNVFPHATGASSTTIPGLVHRLGALTCAGASSATLSNVTKLSGLLLFGECADLVKATCESVSAPKATVKSADAPKARLAS